MKDNERQERLFRIMSYCLLVPLIVYGIAKIAGGRHFEQGKAEQEKVDGMLYVDRIVELKDQKPGMYKVTCSLDHPTNSFRRTKSIITFNTPLITDVKEKDPSWIHFKGLSTILHIHSLSEVEAGQSIELPQNY